MKKSPWSNIFEIFVYNLNVTYKTEVCVHLSLSKNYYFLEFLNYLSKFMFYKILERSFDQSLSKSGSWRKNGNYVCSDVLVGLFGAPGGKKLRSVLGWPTQIPPKSRNKPKRETNIYVETMEL